jgi:acetyl/propionyl-CoA carboxylase alpha subunit
MRQMGSKIVSKEIAAGAGVPTIPSLHATDAAHLAQQAPHVAQRLGYPILVKASAGGGGKGMRIVDPSRPAAALEAGARGLSGCGCDVTAEKYIARHVYINTAFWITW